MRLLTILLLWTAVASASTVSDPYSGTPITVPGAWNAADFDKGGEGIAYHDNIKGNAGGQYRLAEDVDIASDPIEGFIINNFETGEWLQYTIAAAATGNYTLGLRVSNGNFVPPPHFHIEIDGAPVTSSITVASTGSWNTFVWLDVSGVFVTAGVHKFRIVSDQQYFNLVQVRLLSPSGMVSCTPQVLYSCVPYQKP